MQAYYCRCGAWLLNSDAEVGRVELECRSRRCGRRQTVYFGGERSADQIVAAVEDLLERLRARARAPARSA